MEEIEEGEIIEGSPSDPVRTYNLVPSQEEHFTHPQAALSQSHPGILVQCVD
jgi:hypothetical protein